MVLPFILWGVGAAATAYAAKKLFEDSDSDSGRDDDEEDDGEDAVDRVEEKRRQVLCNEASRNIRSLLNEYGISKDDAVSQQVTPSKISKTLTSDKFLADSKARFQKTPDIRKLDVAIRKSEAELDGIRCLRQSLAEIAKSGGQHGNGKRTSK